MADRSRESREFPGTLIIIGVAILLFYIVFIFFNAVSAYIIWDASTMSQSLNSTAYRTMSLVSGLPIMVGISIYIKRWLYND